MRRVFDNGEVLKNCKIYRMLTEQEKTEHVSFHTPGHKKAGWDITELSYSDNLSAPKGCIAEAEADIASILQAKRSFILTDGSTAGIFSMLYAAKTLGAKTVAVCENSHKSVFNACLALGLTPLIYAGKFKKKIPYLPTMYELNEEHAELFQAADVLFFTSPDYYGNVADLLGAREYCREKGKLLLVDGAHGGHLHFERNVYAGSFADMWVDGVHKSLPALTQGAVVSAKNERFAEALAAAADIFRTTSPSYPIMASVEYAVKYPRNRELEESAKALQAHSRMYPARDWTKLSAKFGKYGFAVEKELESEGIFAEFCDGNVVMFYLSPAMKTAELERLKKRLDALFEKYPYEESEEGEKEIQRIPAMPVFDENAPKEWVDIDRAAGRICAMNCGLFPPCTPLIARGERIEKDKIRLLKSADHAFGIRAGKILVLKINDEE